MSQTAEQYFAELAKEAGYTEDQTKVLLELAKNDKVQTKINSTLKTAQDDYQSQLGRVKAADDKVRAYDEWYGKTNAEYLKAVAERDAAMQRINEANGSGNPPAIDTSKFITKEDFLAQLTELRGQSVATMKDLARVASRHATQFHEELNTDELQKLAIENPGLSIAQVYQQMVSPRVEAANKERFEKEKKEFADQAVRDYASRNKLPFDPVPQESAPMYRVTDAKDVPKDMDSELLAAWHGTKNGA